MPARSYGFTLVEALIVVALIASLTVVGFTNLIGIKRKQAVINAAHQVQTYIDTARTRSISVKEDSNGNPSAWFGAIYVKKQQNTKQYEVSYGPYDPSAGMDLKNPPPGTKQASLPPGLKFTSNWNQNKGANFGTLIPFEKLSGEAKQAYRVLPNNKLLSKSNPYNFTAPLVIILHNNFWAQELIINKSGITELGKLSKCTAVLCP